MDAIPKKLMELAQRLKVGEVPRRHTVRAVLKWFGASRRGANVLSDVKMALANLGLQSEPPFDDAGIDELVRFVLDSPSSTVSQSNSHQPQIDTSMDNDHPSAASNHSPNGSDAPSASGDQLEPESEDEQPVVKADDRPVTSQTSDRIRIPVSLGEKVEVSPGTDITFGLSTIRLVGSIELISHSGWKPQPSEVISRWPTLSESP